MAREWRVPTVLVRNCWHHQANMQVKMVATTGRLPVIETALLDMEDTKDSANSTKFENPFREEGQLSKFATDIVDAVKSGRLDQIQPEKSEAQNNNNKEDKNSLEIPESRLKTEVRVERTLVEQPKQSEIVETIVIPPRKLEKKCSCCVLL